MICGKYYWSESKLLKVMGQKKRIRNHFVCPVLFQYDKRQDSLAQHGWKRLPPGGQSEGGQSFLHIEQASKQLQLSGSMELTSCFCKECFYSIFHWKH